MKLSIIIPCYNEKDTILTVIGRVRSAALPVGWEKEIIVVDDGSKEETRRLLRDLDGQKNSNSGVRIIFKDKNEGKGSALKAGFRVASGDYITIQDADMEYNPAEFKELLQPIISGKADVVFGSRVLRSNNVPFDSFYFYGGIAVAKVFNLFFGTRWSDITTCYKVFDRKYIPELLATRNNDFVFDAVELTHVLSRGRTAELPISYKARSRREGKKLNWRHGVKSLFYIVRIRFGLEKYDDHIPFVARTVRFIISGGTAAVVNFVLLYALTEFAHLWYLFSAIAAFIAAFIVSFLMQKYWAFRDHDSSALGRQLPLFLSVAVFNLGLNTALVYLLVEKAHLWYMLAQFLTAATIAFESYFFFNKIFSTPAKTADVRQ